MMRLFLGDDEDDEESADDEDEDASETEGEHPPPRGEGITFILFLAASSSTGAVRNIRRLLWYSYHDERAIHDAGTRSCCHPVTAAASAPAPVPRSAR